MRHNLIVKIKKRNATETHFCCAKSQHFRGDVLMLRKKRNTQPLVLSRYFRFLTNYNLIFFNARLPMQISQTVVSSRNPVSQQNWELFPLPEEMKH